MSHCPADCRAHCTRRHALAFPDCIRAWAWPDHRPCGTASTEIRQSDTIGTVRVPQEIEAVCDAVLDAHPELVAGYLKGALLAHCLAVFFG
jgi:hypothetical protein